MFGIEILSIKREFWLKRRPSIAKSSNADLVGQAVVKHVYDRNFGAFPPFFGKNFPSLLNESHFFLRVIVLHQRVGERHTSCCWFFQTLIS